MLTWHWEERFEGKKNCKPLGLETQSLLSKEDDGFVALVSR